MIRVSIDLVPFGNEGEKRSIGTIEISNEGENGDGSDNYWLEALQEEHTGITAAQTYYTHFSHAREDGVLKLLLKGLSSAFNFSSH